MFCSFFWLFWWCVREETVDTYLYFLWLLCVGCQGGWVVCLEENCPGGFLSLLWRCPVKRYKGLYTLLHQFIEQKFVLHPGCKCPQELV